MSQPTRVVFLSSVSEAGGAQRTHRIAAKSLRVGASLFLLLSAACNSSSTSAAPTDDSAVAVSVSAEGLTLRNPDPDPLAVALFERETAARVMFSPCIDPSPDCVRLPANGTLNVPLSEIEGWRPDARAVVIYTWRVEPDVHGAYRASNLRSRVVRP